MSEDLARFINENYTYVKSDLFTAFMSYSFTKVKEKGHLGLVTPFVWMFIKSYEELRKEIVLSKNISSLIQLEYNAFPEACVPIGAFTLRNYNNKLTGEYIKLTEFKGSENQKHKVLKAIENLNVEYRYTCDMERYKYIPKNILAYWAFENIIEVFKKSNRVDNYCDVKKGMSTANDDYYLKFWYEIDVNKSSIARFNNKNGVKWYPITKGGGFRRWYGNNEYLVNWEKMEQN